jgi:adenylate cyclase
MALGSMLIALGAIAVWQSTQFPTTPVAPAGVAALKVPEGASIAVLPFTNLSGKPEEDWFSDGITETLITDLSRLSNLFVIARNSSFTYKGKAVDVRRVGQELGVRYVLEGSVQRTGDRLRVNAQLLEATTGRHMWAERYDRTLADVFAVQDNITLQIVTELDATLLAGEQARAWRKTTRNRQAYDLYLRAKEHHNRGTREDVARAQALFQQALDLDHRFTTAMVWLGWSHIMQGDSGWSSDWRVSYQKAVASARRAIAIDPALGDAYAGLSQWLPALGEHREGVAAAEKAIALSPNQADALELSGQTLALNGRAEEAVSLIQRALRLNPFPPDWYYDGLGDSLLFLNRIEDAIAAHRKCVQGMPDLMWCRLSLTAGYALAGKTGEAAGQVKDILKINPNITAEANTWVISIGIPQDRARMIAALRIGGLP